MLINVVTMSLPIGCLMVSRNVLGLDDPLSDNISANAIGLLLGLGARFYLFRRFVFQRSITAPDHVFGAEDMEFDEPVSEPTVQEERSSLQTKASRVSG